MLKGIRTWQSVVTAKVYSLQSKESLLIMKHLAIFQLLYKPHELKCRWHHLTFISCFVVCVCCRYFTVSSPLVLFWVSQQTCTVGTLIFCILPKGNSSERWSDLPQSHTARKEKSQDLNPGDKRESWGLVCRTSQFRLYYRLWRRLSAL